MSIGRICIREVHVAEPDEPLFDAVRRMRDVDVGTLVVIGPQRRPVGMLTDRDVALRCVAEGRDPKHTAVSEVMSVPVVAVGEATSIEDALARMAGGPMRRLVVVDEEDRLVGLVALDDLLELLVEEVESIGRLLRRSGAAGD